MPYCPDCGTGVSAEASYCHECGGEVPESRASGKTGGSTEATPPETERTVPEAGDETDATTPPTEEKAESEPEYDTGGVAFFMAIVVGAVMIVGASNLPGFVALLIGAASGGGTYYFLRGRTYKSEVLGDGLYALAVAFPLYAILYYSTSNPFRVGSALLGAFMVSAISAGGGFLANRHAESLKESNQ